MSGTLLRFAALLAIGSALFLPAAAASAQDEAETDLQPPVTGESGEETTDQTGDDGNETPEISAPETFDSLYDEFRTLVTEIRKEGGEPSLKATELRDLQTKVKDFNDVRTPTELSVAVELQLVEWTNQFGAVRDAVFERLKSMTLEHPGLRLQLANELTKTTNRPEEALEVLNDTAIDVTRYPIAAVIHAEALVAAGSYDEAAVALAAIPADARLTPEEIDRIYSVRKQVEDESENWSFERALREAEAAADDLPRVEVTTDKGAFVIELFENEAPNTVANFVALAEAGFYDGMKFHAVSPNMMVSTGDPQTKTAGVALIEGDGPGYTIADETPEEGARSHWPGTVSMVNRRGEDIAGSQFRVTLRRVPTLDGTGAVFGRVIDGMRVVRNLARDDAMLTVRVLRKRDHAYEPVIAKPEETAESGNDEPVADEGETAAEGDAGADDQADIGDGGEGDG